MRRRLALVAVLLASVVAAGVAVTLRVGPAELGLVARGDAVGVLAPGFHVTGFARTARVPLAGQPFAWTIDPGALRPSLAASGRYRLAEPHAGAEARGFEPLSAIETALEAGLPRSPAGCARLSHDFQRFDDLIWVVRQGAREAGFELDALELSFVPDAGRTDAAVDAELLSRSRPGRPVVVVGLDAFDPRIVDELLAAGLLRNWAALAARGRHGRLRSHDPPLSPLLWSSLATGLRPTLHGVVDFVEPAPDGVRPISSRCLRARPLWELAGVAGLDVAVLNWWASAPAKPVRGLLVSDAAVRAHGGEGPEPDSVFPAAALERLARSRPAPAELDAALAALLRGAPAPAAEPRIGELRDALAEALSVERLALEVLAQDKPEMTFIYLGLTDQAAHLFFEEMPPRLASVSEEDYRRYGGIVHGSYLLMDAFLGALAQELPEDAALLVVSDHGFVHGSERRRPAAQGERQSDLLHAPYGVYLFAGQGFRPGPGPPLDLYDVPSLAARLAGLPLAADLAGALPVDVFDTPPETARHVETWQHLVERPTWPPLALGVGCGEDGAATAASEAAWLGRLQALGYLAGERAEAAWEPFLARRNLARAFSDAGDPPRAVAAARAALELRPSDEQARWDLATALSAAGLADEARAELAALAARPQGSLREPAALAAAELALAADEPEQAAAIVAALGATTGWEGAAARGLVALAAERRSEAIEWLREAVRRDPAHALDATMTFHEDILRQPPDRELVAAVAAGLNTAALAGSWPAPLPSDRERSARYRQIGTEELAAGRPAAASVWLRRALASDAEAALPLAAALDAALAAAAGQP